MQYTRSEGHVRLCQALAKLYAPSLALNPMTDIITTGQLINVVGATEAIYSCIQAFINPGDEVILMQPFYDSYPASVIMAGGTPVVVTLSTGDWMLDWDKLEQAVSPKTKMIIVNNPHNPSGKVFTRQELLKLADFATRHDLLVMADEVYETLVFNDAVSPMIKFATLPGMAQRTLTVGSIGKMFGVTGWKIGWVLTTPELARSLWLVHQWVPFCVATPLQVKRFM